MESGDKVLIKKDRIGIITDYTKDKNLYYYMECLSDKSYNFKNSNGDDLEVYDSDIAVGDWVYNLIKKEPLLVSDIECSKINSIKLIKNTNEISKHEKLYSEINLIGETIDGIEKVFDYEHCILLDDYPYESSMFKHFTLQGNDNKIIEGDVIYMGLKNIIGRLFDKTKLEIFKFEDVEFKNNKKQKTKISPIEGFTVKVINKHNKNFNKKGVLHNIFSSNYVVIKEEGTGVLLYGSMLSDLKVISMNLSKANNIRKNKHKTIHVKNQTLKERLDQYIKKSGDKK